MEKEATHDVLWRRLRYMLTPQWDMYTSLRNLLDPEDAVLEVGFGTGGGVVQYAPRVAAVDAIEIDEGAVNFARTTFPLNDVSWVKHDILDGVNKNFYSVAVMIEVLEHIENYDLALRNVKRSLVSGGKFLISARNANADLRRHKELHEREWTAEEFYKTLSGHFDVIDLFDYSFTRRQSEKTKLTPLFAVAYA